VSKKLWVVGWCVALAGLVVSLIAPASSDTSYRGRVLRFASPSAELTEVDVGEPGESLGDYLILNDPVFSRALTEEVGTLRGMCVLVEEDACEIDVTWDLQGGQVTVEGTFHFREVRNEFVVTGGTGAYKTAHGSLVTLSVVGEDIFNYTFRLIL
jgi:hypothetical protein